MKKISITKYFLIILFLPFSILSQSNDLNQSKVSKYELEDHRLHIKGKSFNSSGKVHNVRIRIVHDDGVIDTLLSSNGKYNLHLEMNHKILIEFECLDNMHYIKRIAFNTQVPDNIKRIPFFDLTMNLVEKNLWEIKDSDLDLLDLPVAYLNYDLERGLWYDKNAAFSRIINKKIKSYGIY